MTQKMTIWVQEYLIHARTARADRRQPPHSKHGDLWESSVDSTSNCYAKYISSRLVFVIKQGFGHFGGRQELKQLKTRWNCWVDFACFHDKRIVEGKLLVSAFKCQFLTLAMYFTSWNCISLVQNECMNNLLDLGVLNTMEIPPPPHHPILNRLNSLFKADALNWIEEVAACHCTLRPIVSCSESDLEHL